MHHDRKSVYEQVTAQIIAQLEQGTCPWRKPWRTTLPMNFTTRKPYRGINAIMLFCTRMPSPYWLTYKQCADLGGYIRKGEQGMPITFWSTYNRKSKTTNEATGEESTTSRRSGFFKIYTAFNLSQTNEEFQAKYAPPEVAPVADIAAAESIVANMPNPPAFKDSDSAWYRVSSDELGMPLRSTFTGENAMEEYCATRFHELVHSTMHPKRLALREADERCAFGSPVYAQEELRAEIGASYLCAQTGIIQKTVENSAAYLQHWISVLKGDPKLIMSTASAAQKAVDYIVGKPAYEEREEQATPAEAVTEAELVAV